MTSTLAESFVRAGRRPDAPTSVELPLSYWPGAKLPEWPERLRLIVPPESQVKQMALDFLGGQDPGRVLFRYCLPPELKDGEFQWKLTLACHAELERAAFTLLLETGYFANALGIPPESPQSSRAE